MTLEGVREHQAALQAIADANGGTRAAGTPGYDESVDYVVEQMTAAGYKVTLERRSRSLTGATLSSSRPSTATTRPCVHGSGSGDGHRPRHPGRHQLRHRAPAPAAARRPTSPASPAGEHRAHPARHLRVRREGAQRTGRRRLGGDHLQPGQHARREALIVGTLGRPVVRGRRFRSSARRSPTATRSPAGSQATSRSTAPQTMTQNNVIAEIRGGDPDNVVMVGAHLDSVQPAPASTTTVRAPPPSSRPSRWQGQVTQQGALRMVGRRGGRARRLDRVCQG